MSVPGALVGIVQYHLNSQLACCKAMPMTKWVLMQMSVPGALVSIVQYGLARNFTFVVEDSAQQDLSGGSFTSGSVEQHGHWVAEEVGHGRRKQA